MKRILYFIVVFAPLFSAGQATGSRNCKVEIYLLNNSWYIKRPPGSKLLPMPESSFFVPKTKDFAGDVFIKDDEILGYRVKVDSVFDTRLPNRPFIGYDTVCYFKLSKSAKDKISKLDITVMPVRYAMVLDGKPIIGAYFFNVMYHHGCDWLWTAIYFKDIQDEFSICTPYDKTKRDPRQYQPLLDCFKETKRLTLQY